LDKNVMIKIVGKFLKELKDMLTDKQITVSVTNECIDYLVDKGFDRAMGARPLQRVIDKDIKRPLSKKMLFGELKDGGKLTIDAKKDIVLTVDKQDALQEV